MFCSTAPIPLFLNFLGFWTPGRQKKQPDCLDVTLFPNTENKATGSFSCKQTAGRGVPLLATFFFKPTL